MKRRKRPELHRERADADKLGRHVVPLRDEADEDAPQPVKPLKKLAPPKGAKGRAVPNKRNA